MSTRSRVPLQEDLGVLISKALTVIVDDLHAHLAKAGFADVRPTFGFVFRALHAQAMSLSELAALLKITPQGALKTVSEMIHLGYVERCDDPSDGRVRRLLLTARGSAALREARKYHARLEGELTAALGAPSVAASREVLSRIVDGKGGPSARS